MRKNRIPLREESSEPEGDWLDLEALATVEVGSEDPALPVEGALLPGGRGWRAGEPGAQVLRLLFDEPQRVRRVWIAFEEPAVERTQEFVLRFSDDGGRSYREIVRQQWNFSPGGASREVEDYRVDLAGVTAIELRVVPDVQNEAAVASLARLRLA